MRYADALDFDDEKFRRLTGVKKQTFREMVAILTEAHARKKARGGRPNKLGSVLSFSHFRIGVA